MAVEGHRQFNPGWHLALDLRNMLLVCECVARAALCAPRAVAVTPATTHPAMDPDWRNITAGLHGGPSRASVRA